MLSAVVMSHAGLRFSLYAALSILVMVWGEANDYPEPPVWPGRFHAMMWQSRGGDLAVVDLWYDYTQGRNLNIIQTQSGEEDGPLFDNERANGSTYYYLPAKGKSKYCNIMEFNVGILRPDWLKGATFLGEEKYGIYDCYKWEQGDIPEANLRCLGLGRSSAREVLAQREAVTKQEKGGYDEGRFITYWSEKKTGRPVRWEFFDGSVFEVIRFDEGVTMEDDMFQIPAYCFSEGTESVVIGDEYFVQRE